jgi:hypothetical protein
MNTSNYTQARRYLNKIRYSDTNLDTLHDAYINWFDKTGTDLFNEPIYRVIRVVKMTYLAERKQGQYVTGGKTTQNGKRQKKYITERYIGKRHYKVFEDGSSYGTREVEHHMADKCNPITPEDIYIEKETRQRYMSLSNSEESFRILELKCMGLRNKDIAIEWDVHKSLINYYMRKIDQKVILN